MAFPKSLKFALLLVSFCVFTLNFYVIPTYALNISIDLNPGLSVSKQCSRTCESKFCGVAPFLKYGKYCGLLYSGCPGEVPCDDLDACCKDHDQCIQTKNDYLSQSCSKNLITCVSNFQKRKGRTFDGNTCSVDDVINVIKKAMDAALIAGKIFHKP